MTTYTLLPEGGCGGGGSADFDWLRPIFTKFSAGDIAYPAYKAARGVLEKIAIKYPYVQDPQTGSIKYIDTWNGMWQEGELLTYTEASDMAEAYLEGRLGCR